MYCVRVKGGERECFRLLQCIYGHSGKGAENGDGEEGS